MKKSILIVSGIVLFFFILAISVFYFIGINNKHVNKEQEISQDGKTSVVINYKQGDLSKADTIDLQKKLAKLFVSYKKAQLLTYASTHLDFDTVTLDELHDLEKRNVAAWSDVKKNADDLRSWRKTVAWWNGVLPVAHAATKEDYQAVKKIYKNTPKQLRDISWQLIEIKHHDGLDPEVLKLVSEQFGTTAEQSNLIIQDHYQHMYNNFMDKAEMYDFASKTATKVVKASKVGLAVGGTLMTAGIAGSTVVGAGMFDGALTADLAAEMTAGDAFGLALESTDAALAINQKASTLIFGDKNRSEDFQFMRDSLSPISTILTMKSLATSGLNDDDNLMTVANFAQDAVLKQGAVRINLQKNNAVLKINAPVFKYVEDENGVIKLLPPEFNYHKIIKKEMKKISKELNAVKNDYHGVWEGQMSVSLAPGIILNPNIRLLVDSYGDTKVDISGTANTNLGGGITQLHTIKSTAKGEVKNHELKAEGEFNYVAKVNLPKGVGMPPAFKSMASGMNRLGTVILTGKESNGVIKGVATFSSSAGDIKADFTVKLK